MKRFNYFQPITFAASALSIMLFFQNCGQTSIEHYDENGFSTKQDGLQEPGEPILPAPISEKAMFTVHDSVDGVLIDLSVTDDYRSVLVNLDKTESPSNFRGIKFRQQEIKLKAAKLKALIASLRIEYIEPQGHRCELINSPAALTIHQPRFFAGSDGEDSIQIGKRFNSCDPYYDIVGEGREIFFGLLNRAIDGSI